MRKFSFISHKTAVLIGSVYFYFTVLGLIIHFYACIWIALGDPSYPGEKTWIYSITNRNFNPNDFYKGEWEVYLVAADYTVTTLSSIGYGNVLPSTQREYFFSMFIEFFGIAQFGFAVGNMLKFITLYKNQNELDAEELEDVGVFVFNYESSIQKSNRPPPKIMSRVFKILRENVYQNWGDLFLMNEFYPKLLAIEKRRVI
jgi:hypothetical protein